MVEAQQLDSLFPIFDQKTRVQHIIANAVAASFGAEVRNTTRHELKRRTHMALDIVLQLRGDLQWGIDRIADHLPVYLKKQINGDSWEPSDRRVWLASDGA